VELTDKIRTALQEAKVSFEEKRKSFVTDCPKCGREEIVWIRKDDGRSVCWKCSVYWDITSFFSLLLKKNKAELQGRFFGTASGDTLLKIQVALYSFPNRQDDVQDDDEEHPQDLPIKFPKTEFIPAYQSDRALAYLASRGITDLSQILKFDIRYQAWMDAVVFPVYRDGKIYGYQGRYLNPAPEQPKVMSSEFHKSRFLINYDRAKDEEAMILVEGLIDMVHADIPGYGPVAAFGKLVSEEQIDLLIKAPAETIYVALDRDAYREAQVVAEKLRPHKKVFRLLPPEHRSDIGECTFPEVIESILGAQECTGIRAQEMEVYLKV
jgi:hypothetical protein